jgi:hypothetical protein
VRDKVEDNQNGGDALARKPTGDFSALRGKGLLHTALDFGWQLGERSERCKPAPEVLGSEHYPSLCPSPGTYVLER